METIIPDTVFEKTGLDYTGPLTIKCGHTRKPTIIKAYLCILVSLTVKAVHLELVSDLTTSAFIACLTHFVASVVYPLCCGVTMRQTLLAPLES